MSRSADDAEVTNLEVALRSLQPRVELDREALMYQAGRASVGRRWAWTLATAVSMVLAATFGLMLWARPAPHVVERIVYLPAKPEPAPPREAPSPHPEPTAAAPVESTESDSPMLYQSPYPLRDYVLRWGLDGLPPGPPPAPTYSTDSPASLLQLR
jgi:hypothetical protein